MTKEELELILNEHRLWLKSEGGRRADLQNANLQGANLDFSCWPLWCGSLGVKLDKKQKRQLLYHVLSVCPEYRTATLLKEANKFHRIPEVPKLEIIKKGGK